MNAHRQHYLTANEPDEGIPAWIVPAMLALVGADIFFLTVLFLSI